MKLYHFTKELWLKDIMAFGIVRGDVPITLDGGFQAPWLTTDPKPKNQKWSGDTISYRIEVEIDHVNDRNLWKWSVLAERLSVDPDWYRILDETGGGGSDNWYVYLGRIKPSTFKNIYNIVNGGKVSLPERR
jgi:hypothetical protein